MKKGVLIALVSGLATAALIKAAPALAQAATRNVAIVATADLDLSSNAGRSELDHRLARAAYEVCDSASDADLAGKNEVRECRADVLARARAQTRQLAATRSMIMVAARR